MIATSIPFGAAIPYVQKDIDARVAITKSSEKKLGQALAYLAEFGSPQQVKQLNLLVWSEPRKY